MAAAIPVLWLARHTLLADHGQASPETAVNVYVLQLTSGDELVVRQVLVGDHLDVLVQQWSDYRMQMQRASAPDKLEISDLTTSRHGDDRAVVNAQVWGVWWSADGSGSSMNGSRHQWTFEVHRERSGWRIWRALLPAWCGNHVDLEACR